MDAARALAAGAAALAAGRWDAAREAYESALSAGPSGAALEGLGEALWWAGATERAAHCRARAYAAYRREGDGVSAARAALSAAVSQAADCGNGPAARGWVARAARVLAGRDSELDGWLEVVRGYVSDDPAEALDAAERGLLMAQRDGDVDLELVALADSGAVLVSLGRVGEGLARVDEAMTAALAGEAVRRDTVVMVCCDMLHACEAAGDLDRAGQWCRVADRYAEQYGCPFLFATCRTTYGTVLLDAGCWPQAERELAAALRSAVGASAGVRGRVLTRLADLRVRQGRLEEAGRILRELDAPEALLVEAELCLSRGEPEDALARLRTARAAARLLDLPRALLLQVRAALAAERPEVARAAAEELQRLAGPGRPRLAAGAALARAQLAASRRDRTAAVAGYTEALVELAGLDLPVEAARTRAALAAALERDDPDAARWEAGRALEVLEDVGARQDADRVAALLRRLGVLRRPRSGRRGPRAGSALTARETEVLDLVRQGLSNPQIAARLVLSPRTVAHHVSAVLVKLGVANRTEAAARALGP